MVRDLVFCGFAVGLVTSAPSWGHLAGGFPAESLGVDANVSVLIGVMSLCVSACVYILFTMKTGMPIAGDAGKLVDWD
jgi:hypothetical protein